MENKKKFGKLGMIGLLIILFGIIMLISSYNSNQKQEDFCKQINSGNPNYDCSMPNYDVYLWSIVVFIGIVFKVIYLISNRKK